MVTQRKHSLEYMFLMKSYIVPILQVYLTFLVFSGKCLKYTLRSLACNRNLYVKIFCTRNFLCANSLIPRFSTLYLEVDDIFQDSVSFYC